MKPIRPPSHTNAAAPASTQTTVEKITKQNIQDSMNSYNTALKTEKEKHLVKINEYYSNLSEQEQEEFNNKIRTIGLTATNLGISGTELLTLSKVTNTSPIKGLRMSTNYLKNMMSSVRTSVAIETEEAVELFHKFISICQIMLKKMVVSEKNDFFKEMCFSKCVNKILLN